MKNFFKVIFSVLVLCMINGVSASGKELPAGKDHAFTVPSENNSILASVDGEVITLMDVLVLTAGKERQARAVYSGERLFREISNYRKAAVDDLIDNILIRKEFSKYNFILSGQDVEREIDALALRTGCQSRAQLEKRLHKDGGSLAELRLSIRKNMMVQLMIYRQLKIADQVSPKELYEYYLANASSFVYPDKVELAMLKLDSNRLLLEEEIRKVGEALKNDPEKFSELVKIYSPDLGSDELGEIECKLLRPEFAAAFKEFVPGKIAGPIRIYEGVVWLKVISYTPVKKMTFQEVEAQLKLELERKRRENVIKDYAGKLRSEALIEYYF